MQTSTVDQHVFRRLGLPVTSTHSELETAQFELLQRTLHFAFQNSSFYRRRLARHAPCALHSPEDLAGIPLMDSDDLRSNGHEMLCVSQSAVARVVTMNTSGSTGAPKRLFFSKRDLQATKEFFHDGMLSMIAPDERVLVLLPWELPASVGNLLIDALQSNGIHAEGEWPPDLTRKGAARIRANRISCIVGLPPNLLELSHIIGPGVLRTVLLCSDYAPLALRRRIERNCGCNTYLHYGSTESGLGGAVECSCHDGCHIRESDLFIEVIDPLNGMPLPDNTPGELVLTTLSRDAMPLIRYRTGDRGAKTTAPCLCGGITSRLTMLTGRIQPCELDRGGILFSNELDDLLYPIPGLIDYRARIKRFGGQERLDIVYVGVPGVSVEESAMRAALLDHPMIGGNKAKYGLIPGEIRRTDTFGADHTWKRTITDTREERNSDAIYT